MMLIGEVTLGESIQAWLIVIIGMVVLSVGAGALTYVFIKPIIGWVMEPLEKNSEE
jgi:hypothetical protein